MIFQQGLFAPEFIQDRGVRDILCTALAQAGQPVDLADLLGAAIQQGDPGVLSTFGQVLRPGVGLEKILHVIQSSRPPPSVPAQRPSRESFSALALEALEEFEAVLRGSGGVLDPVTLPLLLFCVLARVDDRNRRRLPDVDVQRAAAHFRGQVAQAMGPSPSAQPRPQRETQQTQQDVTFLLPPQLAPSEDLTQQAKSAQASHSFPFDGTPQYDRLFDAMARVLHRRRINHILLTGERGVGKNTIVSELARRAVAGQIRFLQPRRFLRVACRYIPPDESRQRLAAIMAHVADQPELIVCLDGFSALLRAERNGNNKATLLAALARRDAR